MPDPEHHHRNPGYAAKPQFPTKVWDGTSPSRDQGVYQDPDADDFSQIMVEIQSIETIVSQHTTQITALQEGGGGSGPVTPGDEGTTGTVVLGNSSTATADYAVAEGNTTTASGISSHSEGNSTTASGEDSHSEGQYSLASGDKSHAEGDSTTASSYGSHAEGQNTIASGENSHAEGYETTASGDESHSEGFTTIADGSLSHAEGDSSQSSGYASHSGGIRGKSGLKSQQAYSDGGFGNIGDGQYSTVSLSKATIDNTPIELKIGGGVDSTDGLSIRQGFTYSFLIHIVARKTDGSTHASFIRRGLISNEAGTTSLIGSVETIGTDNNVPGWSIAITADDALVITVTGEATVRWIAKIELVEVGS